MSRLSVSSERVGDDQQPKIMNGDQNAVVSLAFSNDEQGERIVSGDGVGKVRIWDTKEQQPVGAPFTGNPAWLTSVAFSPDNQEIVSASYDGNLHLWPAPRDLQRAVCGMLSSSMNEESWNNYVSTLYPKAKYHDLCPDPAG